MGQHPLIKGMVIYSAVWPSSNICQQAIQGREKYNFAEVARFGVFGTFIVAPSLYAWVKLIGRLVPGNTLKIAVKNGTLTPLSIIMK